MNYLDYLLTRKQNQFVILNLIKGLNFSVTCEQILIPFIDVENEYNDFDERTCVEKYDMCVKMYKKI